MWIWGGLQLAIIVSEKENMSAQILLTSFI